MHENHITREIDIWGDVLCVWEIYTLHSVCAWVREIAGDLESEGRDVCMPERQSDRDLCWGPDFTRERGVSVSERERERGREGARGVVCVHKWRIDRETMLILSEIGL